MSDDDRLLHRIQGEPDSYLFWCPGCKCAHRVDGRWTVADPDEKPTIRASVLHVGPKEGDGSKLPIRCHLFVTAGEIKFLTDCEHDLVGKTVPMEPF